MKVQVYSHKGIFTKYKRKQKFFGDCANGVLDQKRVSHFSCANSYILMTFGVLMVSRQTKDHVSNF